MRERPRAGARGALGAALALSLLLNQGFDWPRRAERLVNALTSASTPRDRRDALRLLGELAARTGLPPGLDLSAVEAARGNVDPDVRAEAWLLLAQLRPEPDALEPALRDASPSVRLVAVRELARLAPGHDSLLRSVSDPDTSVRVAGVSALALRDEAHGISTRGPANQPRAVALLSGALRDADLEVRMAALYALGQRSEPEAAALIASAADDALPELRVAALDALAGASARAPATRGSVLAICQRALDDTDQAVVLSGLRCLERVPRTARAPDAPGSPALDPRVVALTRSFSPVVASAATLLLARETGGTAVRSVALEPAWLPLLERTADRTLGAPEAAELVDALEALVPAGETLVADPLLEWLPRAPRALCARVGALIERSRATIAARPVLALLDAAPANLRASYVRLLASTRGPETDARLLVTLDDPLPAQREAAVFAAGRALRDEALPELLDRLQDVEGTRRRDLLEVLAALLERQRAAAARLSEGAGARPQDPRAASERRLVRTLQRDLSQQDEVCAAIAVRALGALNTQSSRAAVRALLDDPRPARNIAALRASTGDRAAQTQRRRLLDHQAATVAATAMVAIALAHDPLPTAIALDWLRNAAWPRGPTASFVLVRGVARNDASTAHFDPCAWLASDEPITRSNMIAALSRRPSHGCTPRDLAAQRAWLAQQAGTPRRPDEPAALVLEDSSVIVSVPDASGQVGWAQLEVVEEVSAFLPGDGAL